MDKSKSTEEEYASVLQNFQLAGIVAILALTGGATFYHEVEKLNWLDSFYFCTITLTTIGYGDITPHTNLGKLFTIFYAIIGIGIIGTFANLLIKRSVIKRQLREENNKAQKTGVVDK